MQKKTLNLTSSTIVDLNDLTKNPRSYDFFTFSSNLEKLILSGTANTRHIGILWYTTPSGSVGWHYHSMTESVYAISGSQADAKGVYPTGTLYFNPPNSSHEILASTGFFLLAYASPPDFTTTDLGQDYKPIQIDTATADIENSYPFKNKQNGLWVYEIPLSPTGGMSSHLIKVTSQGCLYRANYLLVLSGNIRINGITFGEKMLIVATTAGAQSYEMQTVENKSCLVLGLCWSSYSSPSIALNDADIMRSR